MSLNYQVEDIAQEIWSVDIDEPSDFSVGAVKFWIRGRVGDLNNLLFQSYSMNNSGNEISPLLGEEEKSILKSMFMVWWYGRIIRQNLTSASFTQVLEVASDGGVVRKAQSSTTAQVFERLKKEETENLKSLINSYRVNRNQVGHIAGIDCLDEYGSDSDAHYNRTQSNWY